MTTLSNRFMIILILLSFTSIQAFAASSQDQYDQYFVTVGWLKEKMAAGRLDAPLVILDARGEKAYRWGHIPGALPIFWKQVSDMTPQFPHRGWGTVTDTAVLNKALSQLGITKDSLIIIYADTKKGWGEDGRIFWTLKMAGLFNLKILDGGIDHWEKSNGELTRKRPKIEPGHFSVDHIDRSTVVDTDNLKSDYDAYKIIDTREETEFRGATKFGEKRGGHLPGAILLPYKDFLDNGLLKPVDQLENMLAAKGIQKTDRIVTYCTAGIRSAYVQVVLEMLGYTFAKNYDESFYVWANEPDTIVDTTDGHSN